MTNFLFLVSLMALAYCLYRIRKLKSDVAVACGTAALLLDYIVEKRGALIYLVTEALESDHPPPSGASALEIKVAKLMQTPPSTRKEMEILRNWKPR